jgi:hypothetical protein
MNANDFRRIVLALEKAVEGAHMGHPDFRLDGRIFASLRHDREWGMVVLTPEQQQQFMREHPGVFTPESGAWGRAGCTAVRLESVEEDALGEAATLAWQLAASKGPTKSSKPKPAAKRAAPGRTGKASPVRRSRKA